MCKKIFLVLAILPCFLLGIAQNPDLLYQQFSKGYDDLDAVAIANLYTNDAEVMYLYANSNPQSFKGKAAILASFQSFVDYTKNEDRTVSIVFKVIDRQKVGENFFDNGYYQLTVNAPNQKGFVDYGKISTILQVEAGEWKFKTDVSTSATREEFEKAVAIPTYQEGTLVTLLKERSDEDQIRMLNQAYLDYWLKNDEQGVLSIFTEDARISPNSLAPIDSLHNMQQFWFPKDGSTTIIHQFDAKELSLTIDKDLAYSTQKTILDWSYKKASFKMGQAQKGIDTSVYKRQADGSWKIWRKSWIDYEVTKK